MGFIDFHFAVAGIWFTRVSFGSSWISYVCVHWSLSLGSSSCLDCYCLLRWSWRWVSLYFWRSRYFKFATQSEISIVRTLESIFFFIRIFFAFPKNFSVLSMVTRNCVSFNDTNHDFLFMFTGFINSFLSFKLLYPLSRLTYCAYLVHPIIMTTTNFQMNAPLHLQDSIVVSNKANRIITMVKTSCWKLF